MKKDEFIQKMHGLLSGRADGATPTWIRWVEGCVERKQYAYFTEQPDDIAIGQWLDQLYTVMCIVCKEYGEEAAVRTWELASVSCLYPYELKYAAEYLIDGGDPQGIVDMIDEGTLVDDMMMRTLQEVKKNNQTKKKVRGCR